MPGYEVRELILNSPYDEPVEHRKLEEVALPETSRNVDQRTKEAD